jgi:predicted nucleotidyltransferase
MSRRPLDDTTLAAALSLLEERYHPFAVLLFGSYASGLEKSDSDVDLGLLIGRKPHGELLQGTLRRVCVF